MKFQLLLLLILSPLLHAELRLPKIFGDHMILQREKPVTIWGWATAEESVSITFSGQTKTAQADTKGHWQVQLDPLEAQASGKELRVKAASGERVIQDVLVGDVWLCGGQSNMEWTLRGSRDADIEIPAANYPAIRFLRLPKLARMSPQDDFPVKGPTEATGNWRRAIPEQVESCTGVGYFFARRLHRNLKVPIGLVDTSWGGTMAQHWTTKETLRPIPEMKPYLEKFETAVREWNEAGGEDGALERYNVAMAAYEEAVKNAKEGDPKPRRPNEKSFRNPANEGQPGGMINGVLYPVAKFRYKGILFYQGENNSFGESWKPFYATFPAVISDWRSILHDEALPFGIVQIAGWSNRRSMSYDMNHHCNIIREIQHLTWEHTENTGLIVTYDTNSNGSIHPGRKAPVGERAARWALAEVYKQEGHGTRKPLEWQGPVYAGHEIVGDKVHIRFKEETQRGLRLDQDVEVGFYIAGEDREFHHARARIDGGKNQLIVWHDDIPKPIAVRYAWSNLPMGGLMNAREIPAYPFRTDTWPLTPHQSEGDYEVEKILRPRS